MVSRKLALSWLSVPGVVLLLGSCVSPLARSQLGIDVAGQAGGKSEGESVGWRYVAAPNDEYLVPGPSVLGPEGQRLVFSPGASYCASVGPADLGSKGACLIVSLHDVGEPDPEHGRFGTTPVLIKGDFTRPSVFNKAAIVLYQSSDAAETRRDFRAWFGPILDAKDAPWAARTEFTRCVRGMAVPDNPVDEASVDCRSALEHELQNLIASDEGTLPPDQSACRQAVRAGFVDLYYVSSLYEIVKAAFLAPASLDRDGVFWARRPLTNRVSEWEQMMVQRCGQG